MDDQTRLPEDVELMFDGLEGGMQPTYKARLRAFLLRQQDEITKLKQDIDSLHEQEKRRMKGSAWREKAMRKMAQRIAERAPIIVIEHNDDMVTYRSLTTPDDIYTHFMRASASVYPDGLPTPESQLDSMRNALATANAEIDSNRKKIRALLNGRKRDVAKRHELAVMRRENQIQSHMIESMAISEAECFNCPDDSCHGKNMELIDSEENEYECKLGKSAKECWIAHYRGIAEEIIDHACAEQEKEPVRPGKEEK